MFCDFGIYSSKMVKNSLNRVEGYTDICCSKRNKNSLKNFQLSFTLVHLMIIFQYSVIQFSISENLEKFRRTAYWTTFENSNFLSLSWIGKNGKSSLEQHSNIPVFNLYVNWGKNVSNLWMNCENSGNLHKIRLVIF